MDTTDQTTTGQSHPSQAPGIKRSKKHSNLITDIGSSRHSSIDTDVDTDAASKSHLFPAKPPRNSPLRLRSLLLNSAIRPVNAIVDLCPRFPRILADLVHRSLAVLFHLGNALVQLGLGAGIVDLPMSVSVPCILQQAGETMIVASHDLQGLRRLSWDHLQLRQQRHQPPCPYQHRPSPHPGRAASSREPFQRRLRITAVS